MMDIPKLWEGDPCPLCKTKRIQSKLKFFLPNLHEATLLCERRECPFPFTTRYPDVFVPVDKHGNIIPGEQCENVGKYEDDDSDDSLHLSDTSEDEMCFPEDKICFPGEGPEIKNISADSSEKANNSMCDLDIFDINSIDFESDDNIDIKDIKKEIAALEMIIAEENKYDTLNYIQQSFLSSDISPKEENKSDAVKPDCQEVHGSVPRKNENDGRDAGNPNKSVHENVSQLDKIDNRDSGNPDLSLCENVTRGDEGYDKDVGNQKTSTINKSGSHQSDSGKALLDPEDNENDSKSENTEQFENESESSFLESYDSTDNYCNEDSQAESTDEEKESIDKENSSICENSTTNIGENKELPENSSPVKDLECSTPFTETSVSESIETVPGTSQQSEDRCVYLDNSAENLGTPSVSNSRLIKSILKQPGKPPNSQPKKVFIIVPLDKDRVSVRKRMNKKLCCGDLELENEEQTMEDIEVIYDDDENSGECRIVSVTSKKSSSHNDASSEVRAIFIDESGNNGSGRGRGRGRGRARSKCGGRSRGRGCKKYTVFHKNRIHSQDCLCYLCTDDKCKGETSHLDRALADIFPEQPVVELEEKVRTRRDDAEEFIEYMTGRRNEARKNSRKRKRLFHL